MIAAGTPIAIVAETQGQVDEAFMRLARVGIETTKGYILFKDFKGPVNKIRQVASDEAAKEINGDVQFVDVRRPAEFANGHAAGTVNIPLDRLPREFGRLDPEKPTYVICEGGYRSTIATSILENAGFTKIVNVADGTKKWLENGLPSEGAASSCSAA
ncbi:MAG: hypothetical protein C4325_12290 [Blastocatellia bacterium]